MQQGTIKRNLTIITIALLNFLICTVIVNKASGADGIKIFANGQTEKIFYTRAYLKDGTSYSNLYAMNPDGTEPTQVTDFYPAYASESSVSADGQYLYFTSNYQSYRSYNYEDIFRLEFKGLKLTRITGMEYVSEKKTGSVAPIINDDTFSGISPEQLIASFQGSTTYYNVQKLIDTTGTLDGVPATKVWVKVLKDKFIGSVGFVDVSPGKTAVINMNLSDGNYLAYSPSCSKDGSKFAGIYARAFYDWTMIFRSLSPNIVQTNLTTWDTSGKMIDQQQNSATGDAYPQYSPDGSKIAYTRGGGGKESVVVVPSNGLNDVPTVVAEGGFDTATVTSFGYSNPAWSLDGTKIVCTYTVSSSASINGDLVLLNSDGTGNKIQLTNVPKNAIPVQPAFSPDGEWVAYALVTSKGSILRDTDLMTHNFTANIFKQPISGGEPIQLTTDDAAGEPSWGTIGQVTPPGDTTTTVPGGNVCEGDWPLECGNGDCCSPDHPSCCSLQNPVLKNLCCPADFPYCGRLGRKCYKDPPGLCALTVVAQGDPDVLKTLYRLRDTILRHTDKGKQYKALYYKHSPEFIKILNADAALMEQAENVLYWMLPGIESFTASRKITVTQDMLQEMLRLCESISKKASPDLKQTITLIEKDLRQGQLFDDLVKFDPAVLLQKQRESVAPKSRFLKTFTSASP